MRRALIAAVLAAGAAVLTVPVAAPAQETAATEDRAAVERLVYDFEAAWNRHDMAAFAALFHPDAEWVHWRGGLSSDLVTRVMGG